MPACNIPAEQAVLASMMWDSLAVYEAAEIVSPRDFTRPLHQEVFGALVAMTAGGEPVDPITLGAWLAKVDVVVPRTYLPDLWGMPVPKGTVAAHARIVWECSVRRHVELIGSRLVAMARGLDVPVEQLIGDAFSGLNVLADQASGGQDMGVSASLFVSDPSLRLPPCIPGLLDHQDRVVTVGTEGAGKTTLAYQVGFAAAAGVHPFNPGFEFEPQRVLIIDLENPRGILQRKVGRLLEVAKSYPAWRESNLTLWSHQGGMDLTRPDQAFRLADVIRRCRPDLVVAGPVYKMYVDRGQGPEQLHSQVTAFWDKVLERQGPALWLEHHPPKGHQGQRDLSPFGSSIYARWCEFGLALARQPKTGDLRFDRFKGDREEGRTWPDKVTRAAGWNTRWPWEAVYPAGTFTDRLS
jgi:replicative DNA helicase